MRSIPTALATHLAGEVVTLAVCWRVQRKDGALILGTQHDSDLIVADNSNTIDLVGTYLARAAITGSAVKSTPDMAVDNMEVEGATSEGDLVLLDLSAMDIEAGLFDDAAVTLFLVNWQAPDDGQIILRSGTLGAISRTSERRYKTELRGLTQRLSQNFVRTYGTSCDAELGDARCGLSLAALTLTGHVLTVASNRSFTIEIGNDSPPTTTAIDLYLPMPYDVQVGDTFTIRPGCDKSAAMCKERFSNLVNFRGHGFWVPGLSEMQVFGGQTPERKNTDVGGLWAALIAEWRASSGYAESVYDSVTTPYYNGGLLLWTSGDNESFSMEIKRSYTA
jgi:hypothetical protein